MTVRRFTATIPPLVLQGLTATATSSTTVNVSWNAYPGATAYQVRRNGTLIATPTGTTYSNSGHTASTSYTYAVRPVVGGSGLASAEASVNVTTPAATWSITEAFNSNTLASPWYDDTTITRAAMPGTSDQAYYATWADGAGNSPSGVGASRIQFQASNEVWFSARVHLPTTLPTGHLFYFKTSASDQWEAPTAGGAFYVEPYNGFLHFLNRREDGAWDGSWTTSGVIADGQAHTIVVRLVLNTNGQANGIIQAWLDGTQVLNVSNWRHRTTASAGLNQFLLGPYRQGVLTGAASLYVDDISLSNTGAAPAVGTTYLEYAAASLACQKPAGNLLGLWGRTSFVTEDGVACMQLAVTGAEGNIGGQDKPGAPYSYGAAYGWRRYHRWDMKIASNFDWGPSPRGIKWARFSAPSDVGTMFLVPSGVQFEQAVLGNKTVSYSLNPSLNPAITGWQKYVMEVQMQTSSGSSDGHLKLYVNDALVGELLNLTLEAGGTYQDQWGGFGAWAYTQLRGGPGGNIWIANLKSGDSYNAVSA